MSANHLFATPIPDVISLASQPFIHIHPVQLDEVKLCSSFDPPIHHPPETPDRPLFSSYKPFPPNPSFPPIIPTHPIHLAPPVPN
ncbi:hypothetical protein EYC80_004032 [Monilinia laxa]|uniref:Uncharacterized protein n=1 Tax=Monilinia laxa TaxID=61186 RepID=A0A5N6KLH7_MONLA|nr:hypothetical protein EYC80_004032 [Monilinia laxa]